MFFILSGGVHGLTQGLSLVHAPLLVEKEEAVPLTAITALPLILPLHARPNTNAEVPLPMTTILPHGQY